MARAVALLACSLSLLVVSVAQADVAGPVKAGVALVDGTYHVGNSSGQYASTRDKGYGDVDPNLQQVKNQASYGVQARESVRAMVVKGSDGKLWALVSDDHYIPQDALWRRTAQEISALTNGAINESNLTMAVTHNHSSPSYSAFDWGVWAFQDVFDYRFFSYYAKQNAAALLNAYQDMHDVRVSATVSYFDKFQRNPMGHGTGDDGTPVAFPRAFTDHDLSVVRFDNVDDPANPRPLIVLANIGQHPEDLEGYNLISGEYPAETERMVDRATGATTILTQNATGTSEVERDVNHGIHERELFDHAQYTQMEWAARQLATSILGDYSDLTEQKPNSDTSTRPYGGTPYSDRFVGWMTSFPVGMDDRWFAGPVSHPYPGISSCRTDPAFSGDPRVPVVGLPDCQDMPWGDSLQPITTLGGNTPGIDTDTFEALGIPIPENYSAPSYAALEDEVGVHMQAVRLGPILITVCSCEQWVEQSYNIKTRTDQVPGNEWLGYDPTSPDADPTERCAKNDDGTYAEDGSGTGTWTCSTGGGKLSDKLVEHMRAQILNDATGWDDPTCKELGCGAQAESEPTDLKKIRGNFTHDDTTVRGGSDQTPDYAAHHGYPLTITMGMANDYNGYIASYREYMDHDHYRKALTGWGPHSSDYYATHLTEMGHALNGDSSAAAQLDAETDVTKGSAYAPLAAKEIADQKAEETRVMAVGTAADRAVTDYDATLPDDAGPAAVVAQPKDIQRFDASTFTWVGGNNYTDNPDVKVERLVDGHWQTFADQSGEVPVTVKYPFTASCTKPNEVYGGDITSGDLPNPDPSKADPQCAASDAQNVGQGMASYRQGGQEWKWTATFEAFVSWMQQVDPRDELVDPQGDRYAATPAGEYRFVVNGLHRDAGATVPYKLTSDTFHVSPWKGITIEDAHVESDGKVAFSAGPTHAITEPHVRRSESPDLGNVTFRIGPVDFPDTAADQAATGARFLNHVRGYSDDGSPDNAEQYCLDCTFRPWLDSTGSGRNGALTATVTLHTAGGDQTEELTSTDGHFVTTAALAAGESADIVIHDAWGDVSGTPVTVTG